jgi:hypothetical protein
VPILQNHSRPGQKRRRKHPERRTADSCSLKIMNRRNCGDSLWSSGKTSLRKAVNDEPGTRGWSRRNLVTSVMKGSRSYTRAALFLFSCA